MARNKSATPTPATTATNETKVTEGTQAAPLATAAEMDAAQLSPAMRALLESARSGGDVSTTIGKVYDYIKPDDLIEESKAMPFLIRDAFLRESNLEDNTQEVLYEITMLDGAEYALTLTAIKNGRENKRRTAWVSLFAGAKTPVGPLRLVKTKIERGRWEGKDYVCFVDAKTGAVVGGRPADEASQDDDMPFDN